MPEIAIVVPARLASMRFPRKLLYEIKGKPLILWTAERIASQAPNLPLYFAVDDTTLGDLLAAHGFESILTSQKHPSGTDRIAEANDRIGADYVINVQADEPMVTKDQIDTLARLIRDQADMATLAAPFRREEDFNDYNKVKVVLNDKGRALYFSRSPIPFAREHKGFVDAAWLQKKNALWHLGLYAYSAEFLKKFRNLAPGRLERIEKLEQLRALENGFTIAVGISKKANIGIDTPEDAAAFEALLA